MIDLTDLWFRYADSPGDALIDVALHFEEGEFAVVAGQSGSGKSTLLRCINGLIPHYHGGHFRGDVTVDNRNSREHPPRDFASVVGTVFQDPEYQLITDTPEEEISFALENLGFSPEDIPSRVRTTCALLGIEHLSKRSISTLSGGERQLTALAAALAPGPRAVVLDEPTSQLDPANSRRVIDALTTLGGASNLSIILSEHRLSNLLHSADSVVHMIEGRSHHCRKEEANDALRRDGLLGPALDDEKGVVAPTPGDVVLSADRISFSYREHPVLDSLDLTVREGEMVAITGANGSGKTTLIKHLIGLLRPDSGKVEIGGMNIATSPIQSIARKAGYVPQHPTIMLHQDTVAEELAFTLDGLGRAGDIPGTLDSVGLGGFEHRRPLDLSGGERQRLAIAAVIVAKPRVVLLDEPTRGLSWSAKSALAGTLARAAKDGMAILVATHDTDFVEAFAHRRLRLDGGCIQSDECPGNRKSTANPTDQDRLPLLTTSNPA